MPKILFILLTLVIALSAGTGEAREARSHPAKDRLFVRRGVKRDTKATWTINDPVLELRRDKLFVSIQAPMDTTIVKFFMSVNEELTRFTDAQYKFKLKCNADKFCKRRRGPILEEGDVVYYGMKVKIRDEKTQKFLNWMWLPYPQITTTTSGPPTLSCSFLTPSGTNGCIMTDYNTTYDNSAPGNGRRNPERGLYHYTQSKASSWTPVTNWPLSDWVNEGITLIYRIYVLDTFTDTDISDDILNKIRQDFEDIRDAGLKVLLRFSYSIDINNIEDAPPLQLKIHIQQLTPILQDYVGVIALMQTGFIGVWGEWYYTANYGNEGDISTADYENRRQVVFELLEALPITRQIELRTPRYKQIILDRDTPVGPTEAFTDARVARIGFHNDCFLASDTDYGTYINKEVEYPYLMNETLYVSQGGETCNPNPPRSDCLIALKELEELHFTYLNSEYHPDVLQSWKDQDCYNTIDNSLGYRFIAVSSRIPEVVMIGSSTVVGLKLMNFGYAAPINYRSAQILIIHATTGEEYQSSLASDLDLRYCFPGECFIDAVLSVPSSASLGEYEVLLKLPDGDTSLENLSVYNIVIENLVYSAAMEKRLNLLGSTTVVSHA